MNRPIVHYYIRSERLVIGEPAFVMPVDHPSPLVSNTTLARTSPVVWISSDRTLFDTLNTHYISTGDRDRA